MILRYSGKSKISAELIQDALIELGMNVSFMREGNKGDVNYGREKANTRLNPDISNSTNKMKMRFAFEKAGVPMPKLYSYEKAKELTADGTQLVGRSTHHMKGRGFWLVKTPDEVDSAWRGTRIKQPATHFMEYIEADKEVRVHIFNGKSIRMTEKKYEGETGCHRDYTTVKPTGDKRERKLVRRAAKKAVKALGLDFGAVDILVRDGQPFVLEVNAAPGLGGTMPQVYAKAIKEWYEYN